MQQQKTTDIFIKCAHMNILNHETYMFQARVHGCPAHWSPDVRPRKKTSGSQVTGSLAIVGDPLVTMGFNGHGHP